VKTANGKKPTLSVHQDAICKKRTTTKKQQKKNKLLSIIDKMTQQIKMKMSPY